MKEIVDIIIGRYLSDMGIRGPVHEDEALGNTPSSHEDFPQLCGYTLCSTAVPPPIHLRQVTFWLVKVRRVAAAEAIDIRPGNYDTELVPVIRVLETAFDIWQVTVDS